MKVKISIYDYGQNEITVFTIYAENILNANEIALKLVKATETLIQKKCSAYVEELKT